MGKNEETGLDFIIDKLTNSIENVATGDSFVTDISVVNTEDLKSISKVKGWVFDWKKEYKMPERVIYKLKIINDSTIIQGLISLEVRNDHVFMHLLESAPLNKGSAKVYSGIPGNLVAFACRLSFKSGHKGNVSFISKTQLIDHYEKSLEAFHFGGRIMIIETQAALKLINKYFKNQEYEN